MGEFQSISEEESKQSENKPTSEHEAVPFPSRLDSLKDIPIPRITPAIKGQPAIKGLPVQQEQTLQATQEEDVSSFWHTNPQGESPIRYIKGLSVTHKNKNG